MTAPRGRPPGVGKIPGSGRKRGSLDKGERLLISERMAGDIMKTYRRLGPDWLFEVAKARPDLFINQMLSRLLPPAFKDGADVEFYQQVNVGQLSEMEAARRIAFALSLGMEIAAPVAEIPPREAYQEVPHWRPPEDAPNMPEPTYDDRPLFQSDQKTPTRGVFIFDENDSRSYEDQYRAWDLCRNTKDNTIESYKGSTPEQGGPGPVQHQSSGGKPTVNELRRRQLL